ncbi:MAG: VWA domain-containing protein [Pseudomonadota bacterium]
MLKRCLLIAFALTAACTSVFAQDENSDGAAGRTIIVFDASGSMWGQIKGKAKISIAKETFAKLFGRLNDSSEVGLVAYGHNRKGDCNDIETLVPVGQIASNREALKGAVDRLSPKGKTPLSRAVRKAAEALRYTEEAATVVLVTDGIETCNADPCALANELAQSGVLFKTHVVGFGLSEDEGRQVACLAENTGGLYLPAGDADQLADALERTVAVQQAEPVPSEQTLFDPVDATINFSLVEGGPIIGTTRPDSVKWKFEGPLDKNGQGPEIISPGGREGGLFHTLKSGTYRFTTSFTKFDGANETLFDIGATEQQDVTVSINGAKVEAFADMFTAGSDKDALFNLRWRLTQIETEKIALGNGSAFDFYIPSGEYELEIQPLNGAYGEIEPITFTAQAGDIIPASFVLPHSRVNVQVLEADGSENKDIRYNIRIAKPDGSPGDYHRNVAGPNPTFAMPGSYILTVEMWDGTKRKVEQPLEVGFSETIEKVVKLP